MKIDTINTKITPLNREVVVRVMTPDGYEAGERLPVLYLNDGQDVFNKEDTYRGAESLQLKKYYEDYGKFMPKVILVAIFAPEDSAERTAEYSPYEKNFVVPEGKNFESHIKGEGREYLDWMMGELKEMIDSRYNTKTGPEDTGIGGYSTGGLNCLYAALAYPQVFGRVLCMSPAICIWMDCLQKLLDASRTDHLKYIYLDVGTDEFGRMTTNEEFLEGTLHIYRYFMNSGVDEERMKFNIYPDAKHNQQEWRMRFPDAIRWTFQDY